LDLGGFDRVLHVDRRDRLVATAIVRRETAREWSE